MSQQNERAFPLFEGLEAAKSARIAFLAVYRVVQRGPGEADIERVALAGRWNPDTTDETALAEAFGGGRFYVQAKDDTARFVTGRDVLIEGEPKASGANTATATATTAAAVQQAAPGVLSVQGLDPNTQAIVAMMQQSQAATLAQMAKLTEQIAAASEREATRVREDARSMVETVSRMAEVFAGRPPAPPPPPLELEVVRGMIEQQRKALVEAHEEAAKLRKEVARARDESGDERDGAESLLATTIRIAGPILLPVLAPALAPHADKVAALLVRHLPDLPATLPAPASASAPSLNAGGT